MNDKQLYFVGKVGDPGWYSSYSNERRNQSRATQNTAWL